jgi:hypothetical protein
MDRQKVDKHLGWTVASLLTLLLLLLGVGWAAASPRSPQQVVPVWGPDVRANSDDTDWSQHEPHLAISRTDSDVIVVVAKDYRVANNKEVWIYVSQDGGQTWPLEKQRKVPIDLPDIPNQSDPIAMARDDGRIYVVCLGHGGGHGLFITWTDDDGDTWQDPAIHITYNETPGGLDDKEWLAIDNNPAGPYYHNMYVAWANGGILFKRSIDGGQTWSSYVNLTPGGDTEYPYPIVGADGALYVFYMDGWGYCADGYIKYRKSSDGGVTFGPPVTVVATSQPCSPIHGINGYDQWRFFSIITAAADPNNPDNLWAAWTDDNNITFGKTDILYVRSTDGGATWSAPERLSHDDPDAYVDHITPVFAIGADSRLHAFWLDRRDDPSNILFHGYHTSTADGGDTWEPDSRVSDEPFDLNLYLPPPSGYNAAGDYWGLDVVGAGEEQIVMAAWNTTVETSQDIYVSRGVFTTTIVTLTGQVSDALTLTPIEDADVTAGSGPTVNTGPDGVYTMTLAAGVYDVTAAASGYLSQTITGLEVLTGTVVQNFGLEPAPTYSVTLTGQVSDALTLAPIEGAEVTADPGPTVTTGPDGVYTMTLAPGVYDVTAAASGYLSQTIAGLVVLTGTVVQDFGLEPLLCPEPAIHDVQVLTDDLTASFAAVISFTPPISYLWTFGDGAASSLPAPSHTYAAYGVYSFTLTVTDDCGVDVWSDRVVLPAPPLRIYVPVVYKLQP